jgi:hypothetical protein
VEYSQGYKETRGFPAHGACTARSPRDLQGVKPDIFIMVNTVYER